jgi:hypothetical protein
MWPGSTSRRRACSKWTIKEVRKEKHLGAAPAKGCSGRHDPPFGVRLQRSGASSSEMRQVYASGV